MRQSGEHNKTHTMKWTTSHCNKDVLYFIYLYKIVRPQFLPYTNYYSNNALYWQYWTVLAVGSSTAQPGQQGVCTTGLKHTITNRSLRSRIFLLVFKNSFQHTLHKRQCEQKILPTSQEQRYVQQQKYISKTVYNISFNA